MPAEVARHLVCLAGSSAITEGWTVDSVSHNSRPYPIDVDPQADPRLSPEKETEFEQ